MKIIDLAPTPVRRRVAISLPALALGALALPRRAEAADYPTKPIRDCRALRTRRHHGHRDPDGRRAARPRPRPAGRGGQQARRQQHRRGRRGGDEPARRLRPCNGDRRARRQRHALRRPAALRPGGELRARLARGDRAAGAGEQRPAAGAHARGAHRLCQDAAGGRQLRLQRRRRGGPPDHGGPEAPDRDRPGPRSLPGHAAGAAGPDRGQHRRAVRHLLHAQAAVRRRHDPPARHRQRPTRGLRARAPHLRRGGRARLRFQHLVPPAGAGGHARAGGGAPFGRGRPDRPRPGDGRALRGARLRAGREHAR